MKIQMVDLQSQYLRIKDEIDAGIQEVIMSSIFIRGEKVAEFESSLGSYLNSKFVISCANGTDAIQIALMALDLQRGDEVIIPAFTYVATAEVIALLGLKPVLVDVNPQTFNIEVTQILEKITDRTRVIIPVHLFGQSCDMEPIMQLAKQHNLFVIEDNAQAIGAQYTFMNGERKFTGTIGHIGTTSFFPSKNLGCFGDGGAIFTQDEVLAEKIRMICNHGQKKQYYHEVVGVNSRLDAIQAAVLLVKLKYLNSFIEARQKVAQYYTMKLSTIFEFDCPFVSERSTHVFHQYTIKLKVEFGSNRENIKAFLKEKGISSMVYYPLPIHKQKAYFQENISMPQAEILSKIVLSLPIHTEMNKEQLDYIIDNIITYFDGFSTI
jgi:UDP-2-acetamido-2-deoxy-ribo-hexuluronate aminotransferase